MAEDDDSDLDIEDLLKGLDMDESSNKSGQPPPLSRVPSKSNLKDPTVIKDPKSSEMLSSESAKQTAQSKSVRFSHDIPDSTGTLNKKKPSSMLSNMFFPEDDSTAKKPNDSNQTSQMNKQEISKQRESIQQRLKKVPSDDWLGVGSNEDESPIPTSSSKTQSGSQVPIPRSPVREVPSFKSSPTSDIPQRRPSADQFNEQDLLRLLDSKTSNSSSWESKDKREDNLSKKPPLPPLDMSKHQRRADPGIPGPGLTSGPRSISPSGQFNLGKLADNRDRPDPQVNSSSGINQSPEVGSLSSLNFLQENSKPVPIMQQNKQEIQEPISFLDSLPFLKQRMQGNQGPTGDGGDSQTQTHGHTNTTGQGVVKKKSVVSKVAGVVSTNTNLNTLQLPSHLVNEDELKTMSSSLKTLYRNQLEMLENSYKEQLEFMSLANKRKEDLLKDEMTTLQADYDQRILRLRTELIDNETRHPQKVNADISHLSKHFDKLSSQIEMLKSSSELQNTKIADMNFQDISSSLSKELEKILENKLNSVSKNIEASLLQQLKQSLETSVSQGVSDQSKQFQELKSKLENVTDSTTHNSELVLSKLNETEKNRQTELEKLLKVQKKAKEQAVGSAVNSVTKLFENFREEDMRKRDRLGFQVKEFRKDLRRLYAELENKNNSVNKSQLNMELEQRSITQAIRDINTLLKVTSVNQSSTVTNDMTNQFAAMHSVHQQSQNEMEIKLLKEERNFVSESIAELNVHRRKLTDEKLNLERDRMEFEKDKIRIRDIEMKSKLGLAEAEEIKRNSEVMKLQATKTAGEAESKVQEIEKQRSKMRERIFEIEQKLISREQKLFQEKSDLVREKEFVDKLRDQLLCPGCLGSIKSPLINLAPPPYFQQMRSDGDGIDFGIGDGNRSANNNRMFMQMPRINLTPAEDAYFRKESQYLDDLGSKSFTDL